MGEMEGFPERLRKLRTRREISQKVLAELCGMNKHSIGRYERGEQEPSLQTLIELADFFEVSLDYLLGREIFSKNPF
ncbi:helix-turn-helix domain-containing protein [Evtepia gabavorous]|jgi:transcriptional regulator with XRE-family HTH domain|uniref:helix-turn-helix domain-containing protein n=1 Tax=Evtepia gabavorous TaxID=2211183 RepID=UPI00205AC8A5|nr:MAG TPA: helix-turn-helix domain protein [Caudoviricetes sp.]